MSLCNSDRKDALNFPNVAAASRRHGNDLLVPLKEKVQMNAQTLSKAIDAVAVRNVDDSSRKKIVRVYGVKRSRKLDSNLMHECTMGIGLVFVLVRR